MGGPGGGLPAAAAPGHSRGLPQTEENIPGQCSYVIIGAQRHQCMHAWEVKKGKIKIVQFTVDVQRRINMFMFSTKTWCGRVVYVNKYY